VELETRLWVGGNPDTGALLPATRQSDLGAYMAAGDAKVDTIYVWSQNQDNKLLAGSQRVLPLATYRGA
jgi:hypothetical protein